MLSNCILILISDLLMQRFSFAALLFIQSTLVTAADSVKKSITYLILSALNISSRWDVQSVI